MGKKKVSLGKPNVYFFLYQCSKKLNNVQGKNSPMKKPTCDMQSFFCDKSTTASGITHARIHRWKNRHVTCNFFSVTKVLYCIWNNTCKNSSMKTGCRAMNIQCFISMKKLYEGTCIFSSMKRVFLVVVICMEAFGNHFLRELERTQLIQSLWIYQHNWLY